MNKMNGRWNRFLILLLCRGFACYFIDLFIGEEILVTCHYKTLNTKNKTLNKTLYI